MNQIVYSVGPGSRARGWDAFDRMVSWAVRNRPGTFDTIAAALPEGIEFRLIEQSLRLAVADGRVRQRRVSQISGDTVPRIVTHVVYEPATAAARKVA